MNYTYTINKVLPKAEFMSVTYSAEGYPDYTKNFNPIEFSQEYISELIENFAPNVVEFWERQENHPEEVVIEGGSSAAEAPIISNANFDAAPTIEPQPAFDPFTQYVTLNLIEDSTQETVGWTVHEKTSEEISAFLELWRSTAQVTMRQARLALAQQGFLQTVEDAIALIPEPDKSIITIEWEYSATVERKSQWVTALAPALGLTDEQMDDLFKLAVTL